MPFPGVGNKKFSETLKVLRTPSFKMGNNIHHHSSFYGIQVIIIKGTEYLSFLQSPLSHENCQPMYKYGLTNTVYTSEAHWETVSIGIKSIQKQMMK